MGIGREKEGRAKSRRERVWWEKGVRAKDR